jgi:fermentation-respiration switch protein FrsA (DUF1100 family)
MLMGWQEKTITNRRGLKLAALLGAAEPVSPGRRTGAVKDTPPSRPDPLPPLVVVCHGFTGSKEGGGGAVAMSDQLAHRGFATLLFDFTGCGESEGLWEEITLSRQVDDLGAVVGWARSRGYRKIILNGRSFGGATVLAYAAADRQITAVCTWAAVARPLQLFSGFAGKKISPGGPAGEKIALNDGTGSICLQRRFFQDLQRHDLPDCAARLAPRPLLLIHGTADEVVPVADAQLLFDSAGEPKKLALVKDADHRFTDHWRQAWDLFFNWLQQNTGAPPHSK